MLRQRLVQSVVSDTLGAVAYDPNVYREPIGLVVIRQEDTMPYDAVVLVSSIEEQDFPVHVFSLEDLVEVATRFDTAEDFFF